MECPDLESLSLPSGIRGPAELEWRDHLDHPDPCHHCTVLHDRWPDARCDVSLQGCGNQCGWHRGMGSGRRHSHVVECSDHAARHGPGWFERNRPAECRHSTELGSSAVPVRRNAARVHDPGNRVDRSGSAELMDDNRREHGVDWDHLHRLEPRSRQSLLVLGFGSDHSRDLRHGHGAGASSHPMGCGHGDQHPVHAECKRLVPNQLGSSCPPCGGRCTRCHRLHDRGLHERWFEFHHPDSEHSLDVLSLTGTRGRADLHLSGLCIPE